MPGNESGEGYVYIWQFEVRPQHRAEFLRYYGPDGAWARLFRRSDGYLETLLLCDRDAPDRFLTVDRWKSKAEHDAFKLLHQADYNALDQACESLTLRETSLGAYRSVNS